MTRTPGPLGDGLPIVLIHGGFHELQGPNEIRARWLRRRIGGRGVLSQAANNAAFDRTVDLVTTMTAKVLGPVPCNLG